MPTPIEGRPDEAEADIVFVTVREQDTSSQKETVGPASRIGEQEDIRKVSVRQAKAIFMNDIPDRHEKAPPGEAGQTSWVSLIPDRGAGS